eukprot:4737487-Pleurochrysis_carterae.AAC.7
MDYPVGGSGAVVDALVRGVTKHGGSVRVGCEVSSLLVEEGRCVGVCLKDGEELRCTTAVISNADVWATAALLPPAMRAHFRGRDEGLDEATPETPSFMHLHIGFDAKGLSDQASDATLTSPIFAVDGHPRIEQRSRCAQARNGIYNAQLQRCGRSLFSRFILSHLLLSRFRISSGAFAGL